MIPAEEVPPSCIRDSSWEERVERMESLLADSHKALDLERAAAAAAVHAAMGTKPPEESTGVIS